MNSWYMQSHGVGCLCQYTNIIVSTGGSSCVVRESNGKICMTKHLQHGFTVMRIWKTYRAAAAAMGRFMLDSLIPTRQTRPADVVASNDVVRLFLVPTQSHVTSIGAPIASWISFNSLSISCSQKVANCYVQPISRSSQWSQNKFRSAG